MCKGETSRLVRAHAWELTPLGPSETWPQSLRSAVDLILGCDFPMVLLWGRELIQIYNDGYRKLMGNKHPAGLGQPTRKCWPEVWHINEPIYARVLAGETLTLEDQLFPITRQGYLEQAWFTLCYSPLRDEQSRVAGILVTVFETTQRLLADIERHNALGILKSNEALQTYLVALGDTLRSASNPHEIQAAACRLLGQRLSVGRAYFYNYNQSAQSGSVQDDYVRNGGTSLAGTYRFEDYSAVHTALRVQSPLVVTDLARSPVLTAAERQRFLTLGMAAYVGVSLIRAGELVAVLNISDSIPRDWTPLEVMMVEETGERTWTAVERARAESAAHGANTRAQTEIALRGAGERFRALVTASSDVLYRMNPTWTEMRYLGSAGFLKGTESPKGNWLDEYIPVPERPRVLAAIERATENKSIFELEHQVYREDGSVGWTLSRAVPLFDSQGDITEWFGAANDITARRQAEEDLRRSLAERDALLKELHHRVKNNLQVITSLLEMQANRAETAEIFRAFLEARNRIASLASMHELLNRKGSFSEVEFAVYAKQLAEFIVGFYRMEDRVRVEVKGDGVTLELERGVSLGLLLNELVSNACKHAFPGTRQGLIEIRLAQTDDLLTLEVADDGVGFSAQLRTEQSSSLGITLVQALADQLKATVRFQSNASGTTATIDIPPARLRTGH